MRFLLDTNVISELRKPHPHLAVVSWFAGRRQDELALPAVVLAELQRGAELRRLQDFEHADQLTRYIDGVARRSTIVGMDGAVFRRWAKLMLKQPPTRANDAMIAATAIEHGLTVVSRNVRDFQALGLTVVDPFVDLR